MASVQVTAPRAPLTGWLKKRKSEGGKAQFFTSVNKRFFTLDFEAQILYYSHSEDKKHVSFPMLFRQLLGVQPLASTEPEVQAPPQSASKGYTSSSSIPTAGGLQRLPFSSRALLRTLPSLPSFPKREQHGFVVKLRGKSMELLCDSKEEADLWIGAILEAITIGAITITRRQAKYAATHPPSLGELSSTSSSELSTTPPSSPTPTSGSKSNSGESEQSSPLMLAGGTRREYPPLAPGTQLLWEEQQSTSPMWKHGDILCRSSSQKDLPLAPAISLRATAAGA